MKHIPAIDKQIENRKAIDSGPVIHGYATARERNLDLMVLDEFGLYDDVVPAIVESLRRHGIEQVALTEASSALLGMLWEFTKAGATFEMDMVDTGKSPFYGDDKRFVPGFIITLN